MTQKIEKWLTASQAADFLNISERTLRKLCKEGSIKYALPGKGKKYYFHPSWLNAWVLGYGKRLTPTQRKEVEELQSSV